MLWPQAHTACHIHQKTHLLTWTGMLLAVQTLKTIQSWRTFSKPLSWAQDASSEDFPVPVLSCCLIPCIMVFLSLSQKRWVLITSDGRRRDKDNCLLGAWDSKLWELGWAASSHRAKKHCFQGCRKWKMLRCWDELRNCEPLQHRVLLSTLSGTRVGCRNLPVAARGTTGGKGAEEWKLWRLSIHRI